MGQTIFLFWKNHCENYIKQHIQIYWAWFPTYNVFDELLLSTHIHSWFFLLYKVGFLKGLRSCSNLNVTGVSFQNYPSIKSLEKPERCSPTREAGKVLPNQRCWKGAPQPEKPERCSPKEEKILCPLSRQSLHSRQQIIVEFARAVDILSTSVKGGGTRQESFEKVLWKLRITTQEFSFLFTN